MKIITVTVFLNFIKIVLCKLSPEHIEQVISSMNNYNQRVLKCSIVNPIFGYLFESTGALYNLRFFGPNMRIEKTNDLRNHGLDYSDDCVIKLITELFPSPSGIICDVRNLKDNFGFNFKNNQKEGIQFMSSMFLKVLDIETNFEPINESFKRVEEIMISNNHTIFEDSKSIKLLIIHSFIVNILNNPCDLKEYLEIILKNMAIEKLGSFLLVDVTSVVLRIRKEKLSFPYSELNQPVSNSSIPIYDRKNKVFIDKTFSDCAEILLLHICNCIFYDSATLQYSFDMLNSNLGLYNFYKKYNKLYTITDEIRKDWSKVVQGLEDFKKEDESAYKLHKIVYLKTKRNELDTGIINMMNVLIKIFDLDHQAIWKDFNPDNVFEILENFLQKFSKSRIQINKLSSNELEMNARTEINAEFEIVIEYEKNYKIVMNIKQTKNHASIEVKECKTKTFDTEFPIISNEENILTKLLKNYDNRLKTLYSENISNTYEDIYFSGPIKTNNQKKIVLLKLLEYITINVESSSGDVFKGVYYLILATINLNDVGTKLLFLPCLIYTDLCDYDILQGWKFSLKNDVFNVHKLWSKRILSSRFEKIVFDLTGISKERISLVFDVFNGIKDLNNLSLIGIDDNNALYIANELRKVKKISKLSISRNIIGEKNIVNFTAALGNLTNLISLDISFIIFDYSGSYWISKLLAKLTNLNYLNISCCSLRPDCLYHIVSALRFMKNLKTLNLSNNDLGFQGAKYLLESIGCMKKLENIDFSNNKLTRQEICNIESKISDFPNIKSYNFKNIIISHFNSINYLT